MEWKNLTLDDKEIIDEFTKGKFITCDYNFTNLYLWSQGEKITYAIEENVLIVRGIYDGKYYYFMPIPRTLEFLDNAKKIIKYLLNEKEQIILVPEKWKNYFEDSFVLEEKRDSFDYLYSLESLAYLKGRKYSKKKNRVNNFMKTYDYTYEKISSKNINEVLEFQGNWCHDKSCEIVTVLKNEDIGIHNILNNFDKLNIKGGILKVDGKVIAYSLGEALDDENVVIHIEKGLNEYIGSYQVINMLFLQNEFKDYKFVNREDDFGDLGLREAKESYHPLELLKKYEIVGIK